MIKGGQAEEAVLCTRDKTFALKLVETTNTLLLLPQQEVGREARVFDEMSDSYVCGGATY